MRRRRRNWSFTTFQHYIRFSSHYIHIVIVHTEERKERQNSDTERHGIPPQPPWFLYMPGAQLRYTGSPFYVPIRRTMMNTMDIYNEKMNDMCEPAPGIEPGSSAWNARRVTARPPRLPGWGKELERSIITSDSLELDDDMQHLHSLEMSWTMKY